MVVIRDSKPSLSKKFGKDFLPRVEKYSSVIGYTVEEEADEIKVEFNPDRPDLFSFYALNRAMKCFYDKDYWLFSKPGDSGIDFRIDENVRKLRNYMASFVAVGKPIGDKLQDLIDYQERIHENLGKGRTKVSIGIHDLSKVEPPFEFRAVSMDSIKFATYDGLVTGTPGDILKKHPKGIEFASLIPSVKEVPIILDSRNDVLSMPPVITGIKSVVDSSTSKFFIDITGDDRKATRDAFFLLMNEFSNLGYSPRLTTNHGTAYADLGIEGQYARKMEIGKESSSRISGIEPKREDAVEILRKMGYMAEPSGKWVSVQVPGHRPDVMGEVDVVEDLVKGFGLEKVPESSMDLPLIGQSRKETEFSSLVRDAMIGIGLQEVRTFVVTSSSFYSGLKYSGGLEVLNPKSKDYSVIRDRLFVSILELLRINRRRPMPYRVFEIGEIYHGGKQLTHLCAVIMDTRASFSSIRQVLDNVAHRVGISTIDAKSSDEEGFISGRTGRVFFDGTDVGVAGELSPEILTKFDLDAPAVVFELDLGKIMSLIG